MSDESMRAEDSGEKLPVIVRVFIRILFREGPVVIAFLAMLGVILGFIPSPYLGKPLDELVRAHEAQLTVLQDIRDDLKQWHQNDERRK